MQELFSRKEIFDRELEAMGFGESKPFPLVSDPGQVAVPLLRADRQKALQARAIQLLRARRHGWPVRRGRATFRPARPIG